LERGGGDNQINLSAGDDFTVNYAYLMNKLVDPLD